MTIMESLEALPVPHVKLSVSTAECSSVVHHFPLFFILWLYYETPIFTLFANNNATNNLHCYLQMFKNADFLTPVCLSYLNASATSTTAVKVLFMLDFLTNSYINRIYQQDCAGFLNKFLYQTKQEMLAV